RAHPAHVSTLSGRAIARVRPVMRDDQRRAERLSRVPVAFRPPALASWAILFPPQNPAFLTVGLPDTGTDPDCDGVPTFHTRRCDRGRAPPNPRDCGVLRQPERPTTGACRFSAASPAPRWSFPSAGFEVTRHQQGFTCVHPSDLPLRLWFPDGTGTLGLDHLSF